MDSLFGDLSNNGGLCPPVPGVHQLVFVPCYAPILFWLYNYQALLCTTHLAATKLICPCKLHLLMTVVDDSAACPASAKFTPGRKNPLNALTKWNLLLCQKSHQLLQFARIQIVSNFVLYSSYAFLVTALCTRALASLRNSSQSSLLI